MRLAFTILLFSLSLIAYQNCGSGFTNDPGFFVGQNDANGGASGVSGFSLESCYGEEGCVADPYMLWLKIRESNPYFVPTAPIRDANGQVIGYRIRDGHFTVAGSCGIGNFTRHMVEYTLQESFGGQQVVGRTQGSTGDDRCVLGLFNIPVEANQGITIQRGARYELTVEVMGLGPNFEPIPNPSGTSRSRIEIIFDNIQ